jgi:hypothetical protein
LRRTKVVNAANSIVHEHDQERGQLPVQVQSDSGSRMMSETKGGKVLAEEGEPERPTCESVPVSITFISRPECEPP